MENLLMFILSFSIIFIIYIIIYFIRRKRGTLYKTKDVEILVAKSKLKKKDLDLNKICLITSLLNSLIISITGTICTMIDLGYIWQLAIGFVMLMGLIYVSYTILARVLVKRKKERK